MELKSFFPQNSTVVQVANTEKFGLDQFMDNVTDSLSPPREWIRNGHHNYHYSGQAEEKIQNTGLKFFSRIETDYEQLLKRQEFVKWFFLNDDLIDHLLSTAMPLRKYNGDNKSTMLELSNYRKYISYITDQLATYSEVLFSKSSFEGLSYLNQVGEFIEECDSIKINATLQCSSNNEYSRERSYNFESIKSEIKITGKAQKYVFTILDHIEGEPNHMYRRRVHVSESVLPKVIWQKLMERVFAEYQKELEAMGDKSTEIGISMVIDSITPSSVHFLATVSAFGNEIFLKPVAGMDDDNEEFTVVSFSKTEDPKKCSIKRKTNAVAAMLDLAVVENLKSSKRFVEKTLSSADNFLNSGFLEELLMLASVARYFKKQQGFVFPTLLPQNGFGIKVKAGINPLFSNDTKAVANDVSLNKKVTGLVIYGANTGGKTSYANMVIFNQILAQTGLPIFASSAEISLKNRILLHFPEGNEMMPNQSRFDSELTRLQNLLKSVTPYCLVVFDEAFTGTEVRAGSKQLWDVVKVLDRVECHFLATTHFHNIINSVENLKKVKNVHFTLPVDKKRTNYRIQRGGSSQSFGTEIIKKKGLDFRSMLKLVGKS